MLPLYRCQAGAVQGRQLGQPLLLVRGGAWMLMCDVHGGPPVPVRSRPAAIRGTARTGPAAAVRRGALENNMGIRCVEARQTVDEY